MIEPANQPSSSKSQRNALITSIALAVVGLWAPFFAAIPGVVGTIVAGRVLRRERRAGLDVTKASIALAISILTIIAGVAWVGIAFVVSGPAVFDFTR